MAVLFLCAMPDAALSQPPNDNFADATVLSGVSGQITGTNIDATRELGENSHNQKTVWWKWAAPEAGAFYFDTHGSSFDTILTIYTGSELIHLTQIAYNDDDGSGIASYNNDGRIGNDNSSMTFMAESGTRYYIAVDGYKYSSGSIVLNWRKANPPANDNFANAIELTGVSGQITGSNKEATEEPGEPDQGGYSGGKSVWYSWTAQETGAFYFNIQSTGFDTLLCVYTGSAIGSLTEIECDYVQGTVIFRAESGTRYYIAVNGHKLWGNMVLNSIAVDGYNSYGNIVLSWRKANSPANDDFAYAIELTGISGQIEGSNKEATKELGEPDHGDSGGGGYSVWYSWMAPESNLFYFDTYSTATIYTGSAVNSLTRIADSIFQAQAGTRYYIAVDGYDYGTGNIVLKWNRAIPLTAGQFAMNISGRAFIGGEEIESSDYIIFAFGPGGISDCRGKTIFIRLGGDWGYNLSMVSDKDGEEITFKIADSSTGQIYDISDKIIFKAGGSADKDLDKPLKADFVYPALGETGKSMNVTVSGFGFDENTKVLMYPDIGNTKAIIASVDTPARDIALSGTTAFVSAGNGGLRIIDVSNTAEPQIIGLLETYYAESVAVSGTTVFMTDDNYGLRIIDVKEPAKPQLIASLEIPGASDVAVSGTTAFVAAEDSGLQIIDVSNPAKPRIIASVDTPYALGVAVSGKKVFVADGSGLQIIAVDDPARPQIIASVGMLYAFDITVSATTAYVANWDSGLQIIDISDPAKPQIIGSVDTPGSAYRVAVSGTAAYVADGYSGLQIIDISDLKNPQIVGSVDMAGFASGVAISGTTVFVGAGDLKIIDVRDSEEPQMIAGSVPMPGGSAFGVAVSGTTAFVADLIGLQVIDVRDPKESQIIASLDMLNALGVAVSGTTAYVVCGGYEEDGLQIIDVSEPKKPQFIASIDTPDNAYGVAVSDTSVYVADGYGGLQIIDVNDPAKPKITGSIVVPASGYAYDVAVSGTIAYVAAGNGLQVIDVSNPVQPKIIGSVDTPGVAMGIAVSFTRAYVADRYSGLQIIDVKYPAKPKIIGSVDTPGEAQNVAVSGNTVFVADRYSGLQIIDVSDPTKPQFLASVAMPEIASDVAVFGGKIYVASGISGLVIMPVTEISPVTVNSETSLSLVLPDPQLPGNYSLSISNKEKKLDFKGAVTFIPPEKRYILDTKAIIVAGTSGSDNKIWAETKAATDHAYKTLLYQGYTEETIYYLSPDTASAGVDADAVYANVKNAVTVWTGEDPPATELVVYLADHGTEGAFVINGKEKLRAEELDNWLDTLQLNIPELRLVVVVYDACESGTFLPLLAPPEGKERIVMTSASAQPAYYLDSGRRSFSYQFWDAVYAGQNVGDAFRWGRNQMLTYQKALIDADSSGSSPDPETESKIADPVIFRRGYQPETKRPNIFNYSRPQTLGEETSGNLWAAVAQVGDDIGISRVWAIVMPPDFDPGSPDIPITDLPSFELSNPDGDGVYEGTYDNFTVKGTYTVTLTARNTKNLDSLSRQATVVKSLGNCISQVPEPQTVTGGTSATIRATVICGEITRVWAEVSPPVSGLTVPDAQLADPDGDGTYEGTVSGLIENGSYLITIRAENAQSSADFAPAKTSVIRTESAGADKYETDDTPAEAKRRGDEAQHRTFHDAGDADWIRFGGVAGIVYTIKTNHLSNRCDTAIQIFGRDGKPVSDMKNEAGAGKDEFLEWKCLTSQTCYVKASSSDPSVFGGDVMYDFEIYQPSAPDTGTVRGVVTDSDGKPIPDVMVFTEAGGSDLSREKGEYEMKNPAGTYTLTAQSDAYETVTMPLSLGADETVTQNIVMTPVEVEEGDVNGDGEVNLKDALMSLNITAGRKLLETVFRQADINGDGHIGTEDTLFILQKIAGMR